MNKQPNDNGNIIIYQTEDGLTKIDVNIQGETVWLSLDLMAELFQRDKSTISRHIKNIFSEGELSPEAVVAKFATTATNGKSDHGIPQISKQYAFACRAFLFGYN